MQRRLFYQHYYKMETIKLFKIGSGLLDNELELQQFLKAFSMIPGKKILIHGGGKRATQMNSLLGIESKFHEGRRITDLPSLEVVTMVYAGLINKKVVSQLQANHCNSIGMSGIDGASVQVKKRPAEPIDFGYVGDVTVVNTSLIELLLNNGITPVFCSISGEKEQLLNVNADTIAKEIAVALSYRYNTHLTFIMDKKGVLKNVEDEDSVIETIELNKIEELIDNEVITDGMLPKIKNALEAKKEGVQKVVITSAMSAFHEKALKTEIV